VRPFERAVEAGAMAGGSSMEIQVLVDGSWTWRPGEWPITRERRPRSLCLSALMVGEVPGGRSYLNIRSWVGVFVVVRVAQGVMKGSKTSGSRFSVVAMAVVMFCMNWPVRSQAVLSWSCRISGHRSEVLVVKMLFSPGIFE